MLYKDFKTQTRSKSLDIILFFITGCVGILLCLLWFATNHTATAFNYNILWAFPLNFIFMFLGFKQRFYTKTIHYLKLLIILLCLMVFHQISGVQKFPLTLTPLLIALVIRYIFLIYFYKTTLTQTQQS